jgi:hypothetical protein
MKEYLLGLNFIKFIRKICLFLALKEERRLREFRNRALRKILGLKRFEVVGGWRKLYNEELHNFVLFTKYNYNGLLNEKEMGRTRSTHWGEKECI